VDYSYNIRGWLLGINNPASLVADKDLFGMSLNYHNTSMANSIPQYNGNISEMMYSSAQYDASTSSAASYNLKAKDAYQYQFTYDKLNRILSGVLQKKATTETAFSDFFRLENMSYDNNGNIKTLNRSIKTGTSLALADQLVYNYGNTASTNQLLGVADNSNNPQYFKDNGTNNDYTYDDAGNLTKDANKNISNIAYNYLNLPAQITVLGSTNNDGSISYLYVGGQKVQKLVHYANNSKPDKITDYLAGMVYENNALDFIATPEGRYLPIERIYGTQTPPTGSKLGLYEYSLKDHLGNTRVSCRCGDPKRDTQGAIITGIGAGLEPLKIVQENHYDPWGMSLGNDQTQNPQSLNDQYLYNGKELIQDLGLDTYDYGARNYDSVLGRFFNVDLMAEADEDFSSYQYGANNPISNIDFMGLTDVNKDGKDDGNLLNEVVIKAKRLTNEDTDSKLGTIQTVLDGVGLYPGAGTVAGVLNAGIDIYRGNYGSAGINLISAIPLVGTAIKGAKFISIGSKLISSMAKVKVMKAAMLQGIGAAALIATKWSYKYMPKIPGFQKHHLIPQSLMDEFGSAFKSSGLDIDDGFNIKYLKEKFHAKHPEYTERVREQLQKIINDNGILTRQDILNLSQEMRTLTDQAYKDWKHFGGPKLNDAFK
jgi:RHS repeat-associated protein